MSDGEQLNLFFEKARNTDPPTSHKAAAEVKKTRAGSQRWKLWKAFVTRMPMTDEEAAMVAGISLASEYATRCSELRRAGLIAETGEERPGESGHDRIVSEITPYGWRLFRDSFPE